MHPGGGRAGGGGGRLSRRGPVNKRRGQGGRGTGGTRCGRGGAIQRCGVRPGDRYGIFPIEVRARALEAPGRGVLHLEIGEPEARPAVLAAAIQAPGQAGAGCAQAAALPEVRRAIAADVARLRGVPVDPDQVVVTPGGRPVLSYTVLSGGGGRGAGARPGISDLCDGGSFGGRDTGSPCPCGRSTALACGPPKWAALSGGQAYVGALRADLAVRVRRLAAGLDALGARLSGCARQGDLRGGSGGPPAAAGGGWPSCLARAWVRAGMATCALARGCRPGFG